MPAAAAASVPVAAAAQQPVAAVDAGHSRHVNPPLVIQRPRVCHAFVYHSVVYILFFQPSIHIILREFRNREVLLNEND